MKASIAIDTRGFSAMVRDLSRMSGAPVENVILSEAGAIIGRCIQMTPRGNRERIERSLNFRNRTLWDNGDPDDPKKRGSFVAGFGKRGEGWLFEKSNWDGKGKRPRTIGGKSFHPMEFFHWSSERWQRWQGYVDEIKKKMHDIKAALRSIGVTKGTWLQIARDLGIEQFVRPNPPGYVRNAVSRDGRVYIHGTGRKIRTATEFYVELRNDSQLAIKQGGDRILSLAVQGRLGAFAQNMAHGVFEDLKARARRYPGIFVT